MIALHHRRRNVPHRIREGFRRRCNWQHLAGADRQHLRLGRCFHLHQEAALLRQHDRSERAHRRYHRSARAGAAGRFDHDRSHLAGRIDRGQQSRRKVSDWSGRSAEGFQLLRRAAREPRSDGARDAGERAVCAISLRPAQKAHGPPICPMAKRCSSTTPRCGTSRRAFRS